MPLFYLRSLVVFFALRALSVFLHYLGPSPWGGPLILSPDRFIPDALIIELGIVGFVMLGGASIERVILLFGWGHKLRRTWRAKFLVLCSLGAVFSQVDFEVVRWIGQHMSASYIANFAGARDGKLFSRILSADVLFSSLAALQMLAAFVAGAFLFGRYGHVTGNGDKRMVLALGILTALTLTSPYWFRPSEKRWRRIQPAAIGIAGDAWAALTEAHRPLQPERAHQDLIDMVLGGAYDKGVRPKDPRYPLFRDTNLGSKTIQRFRALPLTEKPDIIVLVFETMRGFNTGLLGDAKSPLASMPRLHKEITENSRYFPRMHSAGYPSVAGAAGMHLSIWPHHTRIVFSSYLHIKTLGFPEILGEAGYQTTALLGADPSFSNFTPWFRRWYQAVEYKKENHHDGPLIDRFIELYDKKVTSTAPLAFTLWTATTHPPYNVPDDAKVKVADSIEERYRQAMRYSDEHLHRLIEHLKKSPRYHRTLIFILGDHSQPTPYQWTHSETVGELNPGHTWTSFAILGGKDIAPAPGRDERAISHVDLAPTILSALDLKVGNHFFGRDVLRDREPRPVWAFRDGAITHEAKGTRSLFRVDSPETQSYSFNYDDPLSYGALEGGQLGQAPADVEVERHRDVARAWAELLDENRVAPD